MKKDENLNVSPHGSNTMLAAVTVDRITPENITSISENEVFVFGSNLSGRHGKGAAKTALGWGAKWGQAAGIQGKTYGIPTKDAAIKRTLRIDEIKPFVDDFIEWAKYHTGNTFYVTEIGCGLAGYKPKDIAPLFAECVNLKNVKLPKRFWHKLVGSNSSQRTRLCAGWGFYNVQPTTKAKYLFKSKKLKYEAK